jgi:hypothetical protein
MVVMMVFRLTAPSAPRRAPRRDDHLHQKSHCRSCFVSQNQIVSNLDISQSLLIPTPISNFREYATRFHVTKHMQPNGTKGLNNGAFQVKPTKYAEFA